jgi:hypothetical protein
MTKPVLFFSADRKKWGYTLGKATEIAYATEDDAFKAAVGVMVRDKRYAELFKGKTWKEIRRMVMGDSPHGPSA